MPTIEFRIDVLGRDGIPHSFITMDNGAGDKRNYGFGPADGESLWGPGIISDNKDHEYQYSYGPIEVTPEQYNKMVEYITESINNPPYYNLPKSILDNGVNQCSQWVNAVAKAGGINWAGFTWNPYGHAMYIGMRKVFGACRSIFTTATKIASPVILDLDGDGVETTSIADGGAYFDHDGNGFAEQTGWASLKNRYTMQDARCKTCPPRRITSFRLLAISR